MAHNPEHAASIIEDLDEQNPTGIETLGPYDKALYHLAQSYTHGGPARGLIERSALDSAEDALAEGQRALARERQQIADGVSEAVARAQHFAYKVG